MIPLRGRSSSPTLGAAPLSRGSAYLLFAVPVFPHPAGGGQKGPASPPGLFVIVPVLLHQDAVGVINSYYLDLDSLSVKAPEQQVLSGFDGYDVVIPQEEAACYISICSEAALNSLVFTNASFVCQ